jgi:uncharacterized repeat protein (TIGR03803 family)
VFKLSAGGVLTTLASFTGAKGASSYAGLTADAAGSLYGTTFYGGSHDVGTVFKLSAGGALTTLASFDGTNGADSFAGQVADAAGNLYGTTRGGGAPGKGAVFKLSDVGFNEPDVAAVPEPASWAMMIAGFGLAGAAARRRRQAVAA